MEYGPRAHQPVNNNQHHDAEGDLSHESLFPRPEATELNSFDGVSQQTIDSETISEGLQQEFADIIERKMDLCSRTRAQSRDAFKKALSFAGGAVVTALAVMPLVHSGSVGFGVFAGISSGIFAVSAVVGTYYGFSFRRLARQVSDLPTDYLPSPIDAAAK